MLGMWGDWIAEDFSLPFCGIQCNPRVSRNQSMNSVIIWWIYTRYRCSYIYIFSPITHFSFEGWFLYSVSFEVNVEYSDVYIAWVVSLASGAHWRNMYKYEEKYASFAKRILHYSPSFVLHIPNAFIKYVLKIEIKFYFRTYNRNIWIYILYMILIALFS